jgi:hypothetical protein
LKNRRDPLTTHLRGKVVHPEVDVVPAIINFGHVGSESSLRTVRVRSRGPASVPKLVVAHPDRPHGIRIRLEDRESDGKPAVILHAEALAGAHRGFDEGFIELKFVDGKHDNLRIKYVKF